MSLSLGIVGMPNVGKSTLFNALTKNNVLAANYPFATIEPNVGIVPVPDERLAHLAKLYQSKNIIPATVTFIDIAGIVRGASTGEGLGNKFLANIRECNAIVQVVRAFKNSNVIHVDGTPNPKRDIESVNTELVLADLQTVDTRLRKLEGEAKRNPKLFAETRDLLMQTKQLLDDGQPLNTTKLDLTQLSDLHLLTAKSFIYVFNLDEQDLSNDSLQAELTQLVAPIRTIFLCAQVESDLIELSEQEAQELLQSLGQETSGLSQLAETGFEILGLQTFLTAGPKEVRAWTIAKGSTAPEAAGAIHTDFQKGFIKAEIVGYHDLINAGSLLAARSAGKTRLEGKDYVMKDGDVVEFRFNN